MHGADSRLGIDGQGCWLLLSDKSVPSLYRYLRARWFCLYLRGVLANGPYLVALDVWAIASVVRLEQQDELATVAVGAGRGPLSGSG